MEISEETNKTDSVEETSETPKVAKDIFTSLEEPTKDDLENSKGAPEAETDNVETEKSKDSAEDEETSKDPTETQAAEKESQETAETSKTSSNEVTTQNE